MIRLLSIGRFSDAKNYDNVPDICSRMLRILNANALNENENENENQASSNENENENENSNQGLRPANQARSATNQGDSRLTKCEARLTEPKATNQGDSRLTEPKATNQAKRLTEPQAIKWYIIGYGGGEALIRQKIREAGMENHVIILGKRSNPYPYIKACDIYVQPSRYEGKSVTVREAQMLCKPIVVTNYPTASSQIRNGVDGVIVPMDNESCAQGIARVILDAPLRQRLTAYLATHDYGNESEVTKIYDLLNENED
ncbi:MAG: glycosyltransferase [Sodaliphilus sp.]